MKTLYTYTTLVHLGKVCALMMLLVLGSVLAGHAQVVDSTKTKTDSTVVRPDSAKTRLNPKTVKPDSLSGKAAARQDSLPAAGGRSGNSKELKKGEVHYQATDSLVFDFRNDRIATLYGSADVQHTSGKLEAGKVKLNLDKNLVTAATQTPQDTLSRPLLTREGEPSVRSNSIAFNYKTERGRFKVARVKVDQGRLIGITVKNTSKDVVYLKDAIYTTSKLEHPSYYFRADKMKIVDQKKIFFQNAHLYILDIPYPIVFPFGYLPGNMKKHQSGLLKPTYAYQQQNTRGIGLQNLGWFQYFSDYVVGQLSGDIFTSGTFFLNGSTTYRKRDAYNGNIRIGYSRERGLEPSDPDFNVNTQKSISINHSQQFSPFASLSANINLRTSNYYKRNSYDIDQRAQTTTQSGISYRYQQPDNIYSFNVSLRQTQNFQTNTTTVQGPSAQFNLKQFSPFSSDNTNTESSKWYQNLSIQYRNSFQSNYDFTPIRGDSAQTNWFEALLHPSEYRQATGNNDQYKYGFQQRASLSVSNLLSSQFLNLSASVNYEDFYYPNTIRKSFNPDSNRVITRKVRGFATARDFSTSLNFSTTVYGISHAKIGNITGFRHTIRPSISFSYSPDFSSDFFGYYRTVQTDTTGRTRRYSIFENGVFRGPSAGEQQSIGFNLSNVFEAKQVKRDSTGEKNENILRLIDQFNLGTSYNFAADSLNLSNLNASLTSSVVKGVNLRASANFNFYKRDSLGTRINDLLISDGGKLAELTNFSLTASTSFSGGAKGLQANPLPYFPAHYDPLNQSIFGVEDPYFNSRPVQPLKSPWSFSVNFRYSWRLSPTGDNQKSATINAQNIQFQLTPEWSFSTRLGYDFIQHKLTPSQFSLTRQIDVWTLSFQMNPFGDFQYYFFKLSVNSSQLQSIFQKLPLLKNLERSSSPSGVGMGRYR